MQAEETLGLVTSDSSEISKNKVLNFFWNFRGPCEYWIKFKVNSQFIWKQLGVF